MLDRTTKTIVFWIVIAVSALLFWRVVKSRAVHETVPEISYSQFLSDLDAGKVAKVMISGGQVRAEYRSGLTFRCAAPRDAAPLLSALQQKGVQVSIRDSAGGSGWLRLLGTWVPLVLFGTLWVFILRRRLGAPQRNPEANSVPSQGLR